MPVPPTRTRSLIRQRDFQFLLGAKLISTCGDMFYLVALPFLVFEIGGGVHTLTMLLTAFGLARVVTALPAGALTDQIGPRRVMLLSDLARAVAVFGVAVSLGQGGTTAPLLLAVMVLGAGEGCFQPASQAMTPTLVPDDKLPAANALAISANLVAVALSPVLAGLGVVAYSPTLMVLLDSGTFLVSMTLLLMIRGGSARRGPDSDASGEGSEIRTVWQFYRSSPLFRVVLLMMAVFSLSVAGTLQVALPVLAIQRPELGAAGYGLLMSSLGVGWLIGAVGSGRAGRLGRQGWMVLALLALDGVLLAALPWAPGTAAMVGIMVLLGAFDGLLLITVLTVLQRMPPPHLRGRVLGLLAFVDFAMYPVSTLLAGTLLSQLPVSSFFVVTGVGVCCVAVIGAISPSVREVRRSPATDVAIRAAAMTSAGPDREEVMG